MESIRINASTGYEVLIGKGVLNSIGDNIKKVLPSGKLCIITDKNVDAFYGKKLQKLLTVSGFCCQKYVVEGGENSKSVTEYLNVLEFLAQNEYTRTDALIAFGGGVVGDLTGFVAATYLRGVPFIQIPTTLLAAVDSSVGGKTAVNLKSGKNLAGAFYQPALVVCDTDIFNTLPSKEYACGMAEVIKYGMIFDGKLLDLLVDGMDKHEQEIISRCVKLKKTVVEQDEFDRGARQLLNFGHTIGHAIEKISNYKYSHGQAVAMGMCLITERAVKNGLCNSVVLDLLNALVVKYALPTVCDIRLEELIEKTLIDKKRKGNNITAVIPTQKGKCELKDMTTDEWKGLILG